MERDGLRPSQFIKSDAADRERARAEGWEAKLLEFPIPDDPQQKSFEAVLDSSAGFMRCSAACEYYRKLALSKGVNFKFGPKEGEYGSIVSTESTTSPGKKRATGIKTKDGLTHSADVVVIAGKSSETDKSGSHLTNVQRVRTPPSFSPIWLTILNHLLAALPPSRLTSPTSLFGTNTRLKSSLSSLGKVPLATRQVKTLAVSTFFLVLLKDWSKLDTAGSRLVIYSPRMALICSNHCAFSSVYKLPAGP